MTTSVAAPRPLAGRRVVLGVTGSISAFKAIEVARRLEDAGAVVDVALTPSAARFVPALTFRSLVHGEVAEDLWDPAAPSEQHVAMGHRTDAMIVAPASATTLAKLAQGIGRQRRHADGAGLRPRRWSSRRRWTT